MELDYEAFRCLVKSGKSSVIKAALAAVSEVHYIDLDNVFCSVGKCSMEDGEHLLYRDMHHLNIDGSGLTLKK